MKRFFVIEADTDFYNVFVREVTQSFEENEVRYVHRPDAQIVAMAQPGKWLSRELDPLLITRGTLESAQPIEEAACNMQK